MLPVAAWTLELGAVSSFSVYSARCAARSAAKACDTNRANAADRAAKRRIEISDPTQVHAAVAAGCRSPHGGAKASAAPPVAREHQHGHMEHRPETMREVGLTRPLLTRERA